VANSTNSSALWCWRACGRRLVFESDKNLFDRNLGSESAVDVREAKICACSAWFGQGRAFGSRIELEAIPSLKRRLPAFYEAPNVRDRQCVWGKTNTS
jgi:hypothetical protein